ncbi:MAG: DUF5055 domain-containing protein [Mageeibacillus sp.]|jgi:hypothetical protein|nr:DUF5055 domain-containing protein [Mageeibacillus sp.]
MTSKIKFTYGGKQYILEFTRNSVKELEKRGFVASEVLEKPLTVLPDMFAGAFIANHRFTKRKVIDEIFAKIDNKEELVNTLAEMYSLVIDEFVDELEKRNKDLSWERI